MKQDTNAPTRARVDDDVLDRLTRDRVLAVVRAHVIPDVLSLCGALADGGISVIELTFTTPGLPRHLTRAIATSAENGLLVGAGTVLSAAQARTAVHCGARFLVTPGLGLEAAQIVEVGHAAEAAVVLGAFTASEVLAAIQLGADAVKIFPAGQAGPRHFTDLRGPFPDVLLLPSGGITAANARSFLEAGAIAVSAGTSVVSATDVEHGAWSAITDRAKVFCDALVADR